MNAIERAALAYARRGLPVLPLWWTENGRMPALPSCPICVAVRISTQTYRPTTRQCEVLANIVAKVRRYAAASQQ